MIEIKKDKYIFSEKASKSINPKCLSRLNNTLTSRYTRNNTHIIKNELTNGRDYLVSKRLLSLGDRG